MPAIAADIIAFVKALGLKEIDLFGFSIGGMVAQQVVLDAPELVRRILLAGTGPSSGEGMQEFTREVMEIVNRPNSTEQERMLDLFFRRARRVMQRARLAQADRRTKAGPRTRSAVQSARPNSSLLLNGVHPCDRPLRRFEEDQAAHSRRQRQGRHHGADHQFLHPSAASNGCRLILYPDSGTARISSFLNSLPKKPPASSPQLEPRRRPSAQPLILNDMHLLIDAAFMARVGDRDGRHGGVVHRDGRLIRVLEDWSPPFSGYHLYYTSRRHPSRRSPHFWRTTGQLSSISRANATSTSRQQIRIVRPAYILPRNDRRCTAIVNRPSQAGAFCS